MSAGNFRAVCDETLRWEGGNCDDPHDPGGRTSRGIIQSEWDKYRRGHPGCPADVFKAPQADVEAIYFKNYWTPVIGEVWFPGADLMVYDIAVNSGTGRPLPWVRKLLNMPNATYAQAAMAADAVADKEGFIEKLSDRRMSFWQSLKTAQYFMKGWARRGAGVEAKALKMLAASQAVDAVEVKHKIEAKATVATNRKNTNIGKAGPAGAGAGGSGWLGWHNFDWTSILAVACGVALVVLVAYFVHHAFVQHRRAQALSAEAAAT